jgi:hypothetical protein
MYQRALTGMDNALGSEHLWILGTTNNLKNLHCEKHQRDIRLSSGLSTILVFYMPIAACWWSPSRCTGEQ